MSDMRIGYVLNADTLGCTVGCRMDSSKNPSFGEMVKIPAQDKRTIYGIISNVHILDDGLIRQLATTPSIETQVIQDNRDNRVIPLELNIIFLGSVSASEINYLLPPNPPLSLESAFPCSPQEIVSFTTAGKGGYLRFMVGEKNMLNFDLVAAHFRNMHVLLEEPQRHVWIENMSQTLVHIYRNDYETLTVLLRTLADSAVFSG